jgi:hypothetical protein
MTILNVVSSLVDVTESLENKKKFSYLNISKGSIYSLNKNAENAFPKLFAKSVIDLFSNNSPSIKKAISHSMVNDVKSGKYKNIGLSPESDYYYSNIFEYYYMNDRDVYNILISRYFKNSPTLVVTLHDKKLITKMFGGFVHVININYSTMYEKFDYIYSQISDFNEGVDYCLMDCGPLSLGVASKIDQNLSMSVIDLGKTVTLHKTSNRNNEKQKTGS